MKKIFSKIIHYLIKKYPNFFSYIYAWIIFYFLCEKKYLKKNYLNILILNKHRFLGEIENLHKRFDFNYFALNHFAQSLISEPFVKDIRNKKRNKKWYEIFRKKYYKNYLNQHSIFLSKFLIYFKKLSGVNLVITPSVWYAQDKPWELASKQTKIKYVALHRENTKDKSIKGLKNLTDAYKYFCPFYYGDYILVYNKLEKQIIFQSGIIQDKKKILITGSSRMDDLYDLNKNKFKKKYISLFSFFENILGYDQIGKNFVMGGFLNNGNGKFSAKKYFLTVHKVFFEIASENRKQMFLIKLKFKNKWKEKIIKIKEQVEKKLNIKIKNIKIIGQEKSAKEILCKSKLVIGINSLALLEARILQIPVIVPIFDELKTKLRKKIYFSSFIKKNELFKVESINSFRKILKIYINKKFTKKKIIYKNLISDYLGYYDNKSTFRVFSALLKISKT